MKISIVTPSFNQAALLERTIVSVLESAAGCGAELEYIIVDGGSTDGSKEIIERYSDKLAWWCSEPDGGQYAAINKGFSKATGDVLAWLNSSDVYLPWTLSTVREIFQQFPEMQWTTSLRKLCIQEDGSFEGMQKMAGFAGRLFYLGKHGGPDNSDFIQQESCFWRRELWESIGGKIPDRCRFAADFHLWAEFFRKAPVYGLDAPLAGFRFHGDSRSTENRYAEEVGTLVREWKETGAWEEVARGYATIERHWEGGRSAWLLKRHGGEEFIWITQTLENLVASALWKLCGLFYLCLKPLLFMVRTLLWPFRRKPPWGY